MIKRRRKPIAPYSARRESERERRAALVELVFRRDAHACVAKSKVPEVRCSQRLDPHEIIPRSAWAHGYLVIDNVITVCGAHHHWIDNHPKLAHAAGLHGYSWERPDVQ